MMSCAVYGCANNTTTSSDPTIQYYYFPKHPVIAQQWVSACWRADPIDINNSQICSIHFDNNSYTSEYKMLDYLGHYTRMLKYDAVPTLYLPNHHTPVIMKADVSQSVTINADNINPHEIKDIMVYEVQSVSDHTSNSNFNANVIKDYIEISSHQPLLDQHIKYSGGDVQLIATNEPFKQVLSSQKQEDNEKYKHITNRQQLESLKQNNIALRRQIVQLEETMKSLQTQVANKNKVVQVKDEELKKMMHQYDRLYRATMTTMEQRNILSKVFSESQIKILTGKKKIYWSNDDMAMGYTIRHLSNKRCYMYLSKNLNIPLPALSSIRRWSTLKKNEFDKEGKKEDHNKFEDEGSD